MKFIVQDTFSIKKVLIFGGFGLCRFQHKVGMNSFPMCMNLFSYGTNSFPWGMYSFRSKIPTVIKQHTTPDLAGLRPVDPFQGILQLVRLHEEEPGELLQGLDLGPQQGHVVRHRRGYIADFAPPSAWKYINCSVGRRC